MKHRNARRITAVSRPATDGPRRYVVGDLPTEPDRYPLALWETDASLRFISKPRLGLIADHAVAELLDVFDVEADQDVVEAHIWALGGQAAVFEIPLYGRPVRCWAFPLREVDGPVTGTVAVALSEADTELVFAPIAHTA